MRTLLSQFCNSFDEVLRPLLDPLNESAEALLKAGPDMPGKAVRADLLDLQHQFEALVRKVSEQQAYVLLFGPLKSGKSTLMNGIARSYVSEVSSLPAYPCMVFVSHGETRSFDVTRYSGRSERFTDPTALHLFINRAHTELADRIRSAEEGGEVFDPALHYPEAIRRVDVRLPAEELAESGAVLVDTPGLYARMRFGYSQMTRDFRDAASCAIFVVKSDNLFLEQVFEEFEELLDLFSRIFLVVNLDSAKRDLAPDGRLVPSLEQEDPLRIIDAFENLAMSAPLKRAADEGRLRIYPVDLLRAASARLAGDDAPEAIQGQIDFEAFQRDLSDYLNSTEYLVAFLGDSLRRAQTLLDEAGRLLGHPEVSKLENMVEDLEARRQDVNRRRQAIERLDSTDWAVVFGELTERLAPIAHFLRRTRDRARFSMAADLETLAADLDVTGLSAWGRLYDQVSGTLEFDLEVPGKPAERLPVSRARSLLGNGDPDVRRATLRGANAAWESVSSTTAACLNAISGTRLSLNKHRGVEHFLDVALFQASISRKTIDAMFTAINEQIELPRRILALKARLLGTEGIAWYDLGAPLPLADQDPLSWAEGKDLVARSFSAAYPLLGEFVNPRKKSRLLVGGLCG